VIYVNAVRSIKDKAVHINKLASWARAVPHSVPDPLIAASAPLVLIDPLEVTIIHDSDLTLS
jgi:hypothetical protein